MGSVSAALDRLQGQRVYLDANLFIYFLEQSTVYFPVVSQVLMACAEHRCFGVTGDAAVAEVMVGAYRQDSPALTARFRSFFANPALLTVLPHDAAAFDLAAMLVAKHKMKLIDALHLATAAQGQCVALITNDQGISAIDGVEVVRISDYL